jgi:hypothetical protein
MLTTFSKESRGNEQFEEYKPATLKNGEKKRKLRNAIGDF